MKVKAVIMRPDRTNDVVRVKKKDIEGKTFRYNNVTYFLHADRFQVTWDGRSITRGFTRRYYTTYYYTEGVSQPLPVPNFLKVEETVLDAHGNPVMNGNGKPKTVQVFPKEMNNGVSGEELAAIFNPWFYRIIASQTKTVWEQLQFWITVGTGIGVIYLVWKLSTLNVDSIDGLTELVNPPPMPPQNGVPGAT